MTKVLEGFLIVNVGGLFVFSVGSALGVLWFRMTRGALEKDTVLFILQIFGGIWAAMDVLYFIVK